MEEPSLLREIGQVAWAGTKFCLVPVAVGGLIFVPLRHHPVIGISVMYLLFVVYMIVFFAWHGYTAKKEHLERRKQLEPLDRAWGDARARLEKSA